MNIILLSGGSGKRVWPLSNEIRSKQFLRLLKDDHGNSESMVQRVYRQINEAAIDSNIVIATGRTQLDSIRNQLGNDVDVVLEPERRDTFPAIALSCAYLVLEKKLHLDDAVLVLPVDPYADIEYFKTLIKMESIVKEGKAKITLMGIKPTYPSSKYGYIIPTKDGSKVERFHEKPSEEVAVKLIEAGAMWNGGVFAFQLGYVMEVIKKYIEFSNYADIERQYQSLPKISFDYEIVEKEASIAMVEYQGIWRDLGTWNTLTEVMDDYKSGNVILADSCVNTHVINELKIPVTVLGTVDLVIAAGPDGILVADKHESDHLKAYVDNISQRNMFEEKSWGEIKVIEDSSYEDGSSSLTRSLTIKAGKAIDYHAHANMDEIWTIMNGRGVLLMDGQVRHVEKGDIIYLARNKKHAIRAISELHVIELQMGSEDDTLTYEWEW